MKQSVMSVRNVSKIYNNKIESTDDLDVIDNISIEIKRGDFISVLGPSGCGKSTLIKILAGLIHDYSGSVEINNESIESGIAYIPQSAQLLPWRTLLQNATLGLEAKNRLDADTRDRAISMLNQYGLDGFENCLPMELSGGMAQRVSVVRALLCDPALLLCDEPFSAIDFAGRLKLNTEFKAECAMKRTTIFVTHNIEEAIFLSNRIIILSKRPAKIIKEYDNIMLSVGCHDAVECRKSPEFSNYFHDIWSTLEKA